MPYNTILVKKEEGVATITLNRPRYRNAMNEEMTEEMVTALTDLARDDEVKVAILTGAGGAFCAGADLSRGADKEQLIEETNPETLRRGDLYWYQVCRLLHTMEKPTIAMVNGVTVGGGLDWALACDIRIASDKARIRSYCHMGVHPEGSSFFLPRIIGYAKAAELFFSADFWDAQKAEKAGIFNRVVPHEELEREVMELARKIAKNPPIAIRIGKFMLRKGMEMDFDTVFNIGAMASTVALNSQDMKEALTAFREKRAPVFKGK